MEYLIYGLLGYFILNGGVTAFNCTKAKSGIVSKNTKKIMGVIQLISGMVLSAVINWVFVERTALFWIAFVAVLMILICGFINLILYMCSVE